jgi:uncharacterized protein (DUF58 family)
MGVSRLKAVLHARWERWWTQRHPASDTLTLTQRNVYIVPTGAGWLFAALLAVLLVASINYQLNLGYLLTFLLAGVGVSSMHTTHATLRGLHLQLRVGEPVFVGDAVALHVTLRDDRRRRLRCGIGLTLEAGSRTPTWTDVPADAAAQLQLAVPATQRGRHPLPRITLETRWPFGLFRAWSYWRAASPMLVWPAPEQPAAPLPWASAPPGHSPHRRHGAAAEPDGVRPYRRGDPLPQVLWKKSAQALAGGGELVSRERAAAAQAELQLTWADAVVPGTASDTERRLSRLTAWVLMAERAGLRYALGLPGHAVAAQHGPPHQRACLDLLAGWGGAAEVGP